MKLLTQIKTYYATFGMWAGSVCYAYAADDAWTKDGVVVLKKAESGLSEIGSVVVVIGITVAGIVAAAMGKIDWSRVIYIAIGAALITFGGPTVASLMSSG